MFFHPCAHKDEKTAKELGAYGFMGSQHPLCAISQAMAIPRWTQRTKARARTILKIRKSVWAVLFLKRHSLFSLAQHHMATLSELIQAVKDSPVPGENIDHEGDKICSVSVQTFILILSPSGVANHKCYCGWVSALFGQCPFELPQYCIHWVCVTKCRWSSDMVMVKCRKSIWRVCWNVFSVYGLED